jgi:small subunit ribosomal protein S4
MGKILGPKCKLCRRAGDKLNLKGERCMTAKCSVTKRNYPPGMHGPKGKKKPTDYALQLNEKQKAKRQYNLMERQFKITFDRAKQQKGNTAENFVKLLEMRLDNTLYRLKLASSRSQARQFVNHGLFTVNDKRMTIPSYSLQTGDVIKIKPSKRQSGPFKELSEKLKKEEAPSWLLFNAGELTAKVLGTPSLETVNPAFNTQLIIEFYSR